MAKAKGREKVRRRLSLSVRLSLLVLFAALLPLAAVVGINDYFARGTLIKQGTNALTTDANAKAAVIDNYLAERLADGEALAQLPTTPAYLTCIDAQALPPEQAAAVEAEANCADPTQGFTFYQGSNCRALNVGIARGNDPVAKQNYYLQWSLFDAKADWLLMSGSSTCATHGHTTVAKEDYAQVMHNKSFISDVYYDPQAKHAYVQIYTPIVPKPGSNQVLGFLRATLTLDSVWSVVASDSGANGTDSYAFITDENGIRIADAHTTDLFTAVQPLDSATAQLISSEQRYGSSGVQQVSLPAVASALKSNTPTQSFQGAADPGSNLTYQFVRIHLNTVPWSYFALSPLSTVTQVADDQIRTSLISAAVIVVLAVLIGLLVGRGTTHPVRDSAAELVGAATALKKLASRQQSSAGEQQWVVDACKTGLDSVSYLSDAMNQAARRIIDASNWFSEYWDRLNEEQARRTVQHLLELARYIDEAARRQQASSERMGKAIAVTMQVSDQLVAGATAATQSADQLEQVVRDLRHVVGGRIPLPEVDDEFGEGEQMGLMQPAASMMPVPGQSPARGIRSGRLQMPVSRPGQRQLAAPAAARAPQAPMASWGGGNQRRPGESQVFNNGGYNSGYNNGGYGDFGTGDLTPEQWANLQGRTSGPSGWGER